MRDHPSSLRQGSPGPQQPPRNLSDELGDFMSSTDEDADYDDDEDDSEEDEHEGGLETPMSSRKSSQSDSFFDEEEEYHPSQFPPLKPFPAAAPPTRKLARIDYATSDDEEVEISRSRRSSGSISSYGYSRPTTATSPTSFRANHPANPAPPPFRRSSTCPVLTPDFLSSAADEVVRMMPEQAEFMSRMVEGWREIQRRSSVSALAPSPSSLGAPSPGMKRPNTAPGGPRFSPSVNFSSSFPRTLPERLEEEPGSTTESEAGFEVEGEAEVEEEEEEEEEETGEGVESTLDELRVMAKENAERAIVGANGREERARFEVVEKCIDTIGRVYQRKPVRGRRRRRLGMKCVGALVRICEMFASEGADGGSYRFESGFLDEVTESTESEAEDYADDEAEDEIDEKVPFPDFVDTDFFARGPAMETDLMRPPPSPTKDPLDDRRHAELVDQAKEELETLLVKAAEAETPFEERHSRVVYAVEAYLAKLSEMEASHDREFKWHAELKAFHVAMGSRNMLGSEPGTAMALVASLSFCFIPIATVLWYVTEPTTSWMLWRILIPIGCYFLLLAGFYIDQKEAREALYEEHLPLEARDMRRRHKREKDLLQAAHERAVQRVYSPDA